MARRTWRHWTSACGLPGLRSGPLDPVGRQPAPDARRGDDGAVLLRRGGEILRRPGRRLLERQLARHLRRGDDPHAAADEPRGHVRAVERERADEAEPLRIGHVHLGENRLRRLPGRDPRGDRRQRLDPVAAAREHHEAVAVQQQLVGHVGVERERVEQARRRIADVDGVQLPVRECEERVAVRLDDVGLVDALLLHVRAGEVDALLGRAGIGGSRRRLDPATEERRAEPVGADEAARVRLRVGEQLAARAEGGETLRLRGLGCRTVSRSDQCGDHEQGERRDERHPFQKVHHARYTSQRPETSPPQV